METNTKTNRKNKIMSGIAYAITISLVSLAIQHFLFPPFDKGVKKAVEELNKTCPQMVDEYSRLDSATIPFKKVIQYNYTLVEIEKSEINLDTVRKYIEASLIENIKQNPELKAYRKNKVTFNYRYNDKNGELAYDLSITPDVYSKELE